MDYRWIDKTSNDAYLYSHIKRLIEMCSIYYDNTHKIFSCQISHILRTITRFPSLPHACAVQSWLGYKYWCFAQSTPISSLSNNSIEDYHKSLQKLTLLKHITAVLSNMLESPLINYA
jgi:hypothetical protein